MLSKSFRLVHSSSIHRTRISDVTTTTLAGHTQMRLMSTDVHDDNVAECAHKYYSRAHFAHIDEYTVCGSSSIFNNVLLVCRYTLNQTILHITMLSHRANKFNPSLYEYYIHTNIRNGA